ncbi:ABC transporter permease [Marinobacter koreensis]|uniref:Transport permease protein n=1 Tax=Marinobacter koreensis TaxID=335974 RepID=A0ABW0RMV7_9GAMM|nr:ABC transporter permease [Marinobacter koreensis]MCK7549678.1 ABC transporter permease [Marinobacter koreensis]
MNGSRLLAQIIKELLSLLRDPRARAILILPPLLQLMIFSFAATLEVRNATVAVFNEDIGQPAREFVADVTSASFVGHVIMVHNRQQQDELIEQGRALLTLHIPEDFSRHRLAGQPAPVQVILDGQQANAAQVALSYLQAIAMEQGNRTEPMVLRHAFNPNLIYQWYVVPSLSGILSMLIALAVTALSISRERELGTFDQLLVSPTTPLEIILAKCLPAVLMGFVMGSVMITAALLLFQVPFTGSLLWLAGALVLFIISVVGIGLMVSAVSETQQQAILGVFALAVPMVLMSGFATPVENMPDLLQWMAQAIPLTHFLVIVQGSFLKSIPADVVVSHLWPLALIALVTLSGATLVVRKRLH